MFNLSEIIATLNQYAPLTLTETPLTAAVMMVLLTHEDDEIQIVLTKRADNLPTYPGHYSFPGGMRDAEDADLYATAQRELHEELGIAPHLYQSIGQLDDLNDRYGNLVRPFVIVMTQQDFETYHQIAQDEIATLYFFPISHLIYIRDNEALHELTKRRPSFSFTDGDVFIWGLTAAVLSRFFAILHRKS